MYIIICLSYNKICTFLALEMTWRPWRYYCGRGDSENIMVYIVHVPISTKSVPFPFPPIPVSTK